MDEYQFESCIFRSHKVLQKRVLPASLQGLRLDTDVDIQQESFGYIVGWIKRGEFLRYTIEVSEDGTVTRFAHFYGLVVGYLILVKCGSTARHKKTHTLP